MARSRLGDIHIVEPTNEKTTVRDCIGNFQTLANSSDELHKIFPKHTPGIQELISDIPHDGRSIMNLSQSKQLKCHKKDNVGFYDVYGRLRRDDYSSTIT